jgi:hypothetical protein
MPRIAAHWIRPFAARLIELNPHLQPLDAVRCAVLAHGSCGKLAPTMAADLCTPVAPRSGRSVRPETDSSSSARESGLE